MTAPSARAGGGCVVAIFGPTGSGKTAVAVEVAHRVGARVLSADSMQLYRGFPVLTNQPTPEERRRAPHALIAVADPEEEWTVARYAREARRLIDEDVECTGWAVIAGGTGLYLRAALAPLDIPEVHDPDLRARLNARVEQEGPEAVHRELAARDPEAAKQVDALNPRRVVRALEVVMSEGPGAWGGRDDLWRPKYRHPTLVVGLTLDRGRLYEKINARAADMVERGAVEEVAAHLERHGDQESRGGVTKAMGFQEIRRYLEGEQSRAEMVERLAASHRRYVRAQLTWLRRLEDVAMMDASTGSPGEVADEILALAEDRCRS